MTKQLIYHLTNVAAGCMPTGPNSFCQQYKYKYHPPLRYTRLGLPIHPWNDK